MKSEDVLTISLRFFNDIIGSIIPGAILLLGIGILLPKMFQHLIITCGLGEAAKIWFFIILAYVLGNGITSFGNWLVIRPINFILKYIIKLNKFLLCKFKFLPDIYKVLPSSLVPEEVWSNEFVDDPSVKYFIERMPLELTKNMNFSNSISKLHSLRNVAMSIPGIDRDLTYRFMFLSLLSQGIATVIIILLLVWWLTSIFGNDSILSINYSTMYAWFMLFLFIIFLDRRYEFNKRALTIPFSMAVDSLRNEAPKENKNMVIYLAGGFTSNWQSDVIKLNPSLSFLDPRNHQLSETLQYTNWDLQAIRKSDLIFAYLEKNNPGGYALALEIGYAKALGKHIIFVDEKSKSNDEISKYLAMIHACADVTFNTLNEGILYLAKLKEISV
ncbi:MAG: nucleoside 2-deoxyribosyltransferase domain-containing protein [Desulfomonilia bacterium]|jgi:hypothetical protein